MAWCVARLPTHCSVVDPASLSVALLFLPCWFCGFTAAAGTILRGRRISSVALFGVMVELMPGKSGLVHLSELGEEGQVLHEVPPQFTVGV